MKTIQTNVKLTEWERNKLEKLAKEYDLPITRIITLAIDTLDKQKFQGWANYETWAVNLWLNNTQSDQEWVTELANSEQTGREKDDALRDMMRYELNPLSGDASVWCDLLGGALDNVHWSDIINHFLED